MSYSLAMSLSRCIYLAGADGTGKTTQAKAILSLLQNRGVPARYVWLRFPRLFCIPFLVYARLRGYSHQEMVDGHFHGYWNFGASWLMSNVFPWALWLDTFLIALVKIYLPLVLGYTLVCDRFVGDILVDLMAGLNDPRFDERIPGCLFLALLPRNIQVVVLDLDTDTARQRCPELKGDRSHSQRRAFYLDLARRHRLSVICTDTSIETTTYQLIKVITGNGDLQTTKLNFAFDPPTERNCPSEIKS